MTMAMKISLLSRAYSLVFVLPVLLTTLSLLLVTSRSAQANAVTITDEAGVLDGGKVRAEAGKLSNPLVIYTTRTFGGDQEALNGAAREQLTTQDAIAIEIDTTHRHLSIQSGSKVKLSNEQAEEAVGAFRDHFHGGDYTGATIAAIDSVRDTLDSDHSSLTPVGIIVVLLLVGGALTMALFFALHRRQRPPRDGGRGIGPHAYNHSHIYYGGSHYTGSSTGGSFGGGAGGSF